jgi:hypothetical protein
MGLKLETSNISHRAGAKLFCMCSTLNTEHFRHQGGQKELFTDQKIQNTAISRLRQPIEGFFNWLIEKTGIQDASKTRATKGILSHVYGKIAASAVFLAIF